MSHLQRITLDRDKGVTSFTVLNDGKPVDLEVAIQELLTVAREKGFITNISMEVIHK